MYTLSLDTTIKPYTDQLTHLNDPVIAPELRVIFLIQSDFLTADSDIMLHEGARTHVSSHTHGRMYIGARTGNAVRK